MTAARGAWRSTRQQWLGPLAGGTPVCSTRQVPVFGKAAPRTSEPHADAPLARGSLDELVRLHSAYVAGLAYRLMGRDSDVDDVVQDVFFAFIRFHSKIREHGAVRAWLATTTVRLSHKRLRARAWRFRVLLGLEEHGDALSTPGAGASPEQHAALRSVHHALEGVPAAARIAWLLRYVEQETVEDVARLAGCSVATAKRRIALAQDSVKRAFDV